MSEELIKDIKEKIFPIVQNNDKGYGWSHGVEVYTLAKAINIKYNIYHGDKDIITAGLLHDIGLIAGRNNHHKVGVWILTEGHLKKWFNSLCEIHELNKTPIIHAIESHRASTDCDHLPLSRLISMGDRGIPSITKHVLRLKFIGNDLRWVMEHIKEKYSEFGYIKYDPIFVEYFGKRFKIFMEDCLDSAKIASIYNYMHFSNIPDEPINMDYICNFIKSDN